MNKGTCLALAAWLPSQLLCAGVVRPPKYSVDTLRANPAGLKHEHSNLAQLWPSARNVFAPPPVPEAQGIVSICPDFLMGPFVGHGPSQELEGSPGPRAEDRAQAST